MEQEKGISAWQLVFTAYLCIKVVLFYITDCNFVIDPISLCFICAKQHKHRHLPLYVSILVWSALNMTLVLYPYLTQG